MMLKIKQLSTLGFMVYFLGMSLGMALNLHYCEGGVADFAFLNNTANCDSHHPVDSGNDICLIHTDNLIQHCSTSDQHNCCSDKSIYLHFDSKLLISTYNHSFNALAVLLCHKIVIDDLVEEAIFIEASFFLEQVDSKPPPFILFQQLLVYA